MSLRVRRLCAGLLCLFAPSLRLSLRAQTVVRGDKQSAHAQPRSAGEGRAARAFAAARNLGAPELYAFLKPFPKGADLHMHLSGAVYAETLIAEAAQTGLCIAPPPPACTAGVKLESESQTPASRSAPPPAPSSARSCPVPVLDPKLPPLPLSLVLPAPHAAGPPSCAAGELPAVAALESQPVFDALVDSLSMRGYVPTPGVTGHDQFFATFARVDGLKSFVPNWLDEVATRAAAQNEQYLEIMQTPTYRGARALGIKLGWPPGAETSVTREQLSKLREALLAGGLRDEVATDHKEFAGFLSARRALEHCGAVASSNSTDPSSLPDPESPTLDLSTRGKAPTEANPACAVQLRFLFQVLRANPPQQVFAQTLLAFEVVEAELDSGHPLVLGLNFVQPEDAHLAMRDYHLQMQMMDYLHTVYPRVRISLHAGELAHGLVPPDGLTFHIREAVELGHAERIGHGMDVLYETHPDQLLAEMAEKHVMVEVNLTSNDVILGQTRTDHPLAAYRAAHVPVALSTDDEGVSRIDLTHEYVKAAEEQNLTYADLKGSARTSLEHSFLPGPSLWAQPDDFTRHAAPCGASIGPRSDPSPPCAAFLKTSPRATQQYDLERRLASFEDSVR